MIRIQGFAAALLLAASAARAGDVKVTLQHQFTAGPSVSVTMMEGCEWKDAPGEKVKAPKLKGTAKWGELTLGVGADKVYTVLYDDAGLGEDLLYVDANNNEDLTDDGEPAKQYTKDATSLGKYWKLLVDRGKKAPPSEYQVYIYAYDSNKKGFSAYRSMDWFEGKATLAGTEVKFALVDLNNDAIFSDLDHLALSVDYNLDGKYDGERDSNEYYLANQPFAAAGKGWRLKSVSDDGSEAVIEETDPVEMRAPLGAGSPSLDFTGKDRDGNDVSLSQFMGKVVLLWFWSYQSGDVSLALDQHRKIYDANRDKGYQILGVCIDKEEEKAREFAESHKMDWPIVYDAGFMEGDIAKLYRLWTYPKMYLIDADGIIRDNSMYVGNLEKAVVEMLSDADAEPLTATKPADLAAFVPRVDKGDWWLVFHQRRSDYDTGEFQLYMVMEASAEKVGIVVSSTSGWSYELAVDRANWCATKVIPTFTDWDQKAERIRIAPEKERIVAIQGAPSIAMLRQYPNLDVLFHAFPASSSGTLTSLTEQPADKTAVETAPLECASFIDANGRLVGKFKATLDRHVLRVKQTWEQGLPFPRRITYSNSITGSRGTLVLVRSGKRVGLAFPAVPDAHRICGMDSQITDPPVSRCPSKNLVGEDAVAAACAKLAPGKPSQPLDFPGAGYWKRGDIMKVYWQVRAIPKVVSGPKPAQEGKQVEIPVSGTWILECVDLRRVGDEDLVFLQAYGDDTRTFSYDTAYAGQQGQQGRTIADLMSGTGPIVFSNPEYWNDPDPKKAKWDRVSYLRARKYYGGYNFNTVYANGKQATSWILALRREDLSMRAAYGFHLDANFRAGEFAVVADQFKPGPAFVRQSLQLVRPQDWLLLQSFPGLKTGAAKGNVLNLSPKDEGFFRYEMLKDEECVTQLVKNDKFFTAFAELLAKRSPPPDAKNGKKRQAKVSLTEQDVAKLESGFANGDYSGVIRRFEEGAPKRDLNVFRSTNGPGLWVYQGYEGTFAWWREEVLLNWKENYLARLRMYIPLPPKPGC